MNPTDIDSEDQGALSRLRLILAASSVTERVVFAALAVAAVASALAAATIAVGQTLVVAPREGGSLVEGVVGTPRFVNPVLARATSDADRSLVALVFAGLTRLAPDGTIEPDLATYEVSDDGLEYRFRIRPDAEFQDGEPVLAEDVAFTIAKVQDPEVQSPRADAWAGVRVEVLGERELALHLPKAAPHFLRETTLGILPRHRFEDVAGQDFLLADANTYAVGAGPYRVDSIERKGEATEAYRLSAFEAYDGAEPYLSSVTLRFYPEEADLLDAVKSGEVESAFGLSPAAAHELEGRAARLVGQTRPWIFAAFFNQSHAPVLADHDVREALSDAIDREAIVRDVLKGYGATLDGPTALVTPPPAAELAPGDGAATSTPSVDRPAAARAALEADGFAAGDDGVLARKGERLSLALVTADTPELVAAAQAVAADWRDAGAEVRVEVYAAADLAEEAIRPREYDALLFGEVIGRDVDFYSFWHSSQRADPGLNVAGYANAKVDGLLEDLRDEADPEARAKLLARAAAIIADDYPAAFLYAPEAVYAVPADLEAPLVPRLAAPSDRFALVRSWHRANDAVWPFFARGEAGS